MTKGWWVGAWIAVGCAGDDVSQSPSEVPSDPDTDTDTDADADIASDADQDGYSYDVDCDDADPAVYPGARDVCGDRKVTDCDRSSDDGLVTLDGAASFTDLQDALDKASPGSEVLLCAGTYVGPFEALVAVDLVSLDGNAATILDGDLRGTTLRLPSDSAITGLTVTRGLSAGGGGIQLSTTGGTLTITDAVVTGNRGLFGGGIKLASGTDVVLARTTVSRNRADESGGGVYVHLGDTVDATGSTIEGNIADHGGGVMFSGGDWTGGRIVGNVATSSGFWFGGTGIAVIIDASVTGTEITGNLGPYGAVSVHTLATLVLTDVDVHDNDAGVTDGVGGGLLVDSGYVVLEGTTAFTGNRASFGAGAYLYGATVTGGLFADNMAEVAGGGLIVGEAILQDVTVESNQAAVAAGLFAFRDLTVTGGRIAGNQASEIGGGLATAIGLGSYDLKIALDGVEIVDNSAPSGGGLSLDIGPTTITDATVLRNQADLGGGATVTGDALLSSVSTDWGADADDNLPDDVYAALGFVGYGAAATFDCDASGCLPPP